MLHLIIASLIFAFSPGLIKGRLAGLDSAFITAARLGLALLVFAPFFRPRGLTLRTAAALLGIGALQFGLMYLAYNESYRFLQAYEVALFTITTPIFVTLVADALVGTLRPRALVAALLAVAGAAVVIVRTPHLQLTLTGVALVQLSNLAFAAGQVLYQRLRTREPQLRDSHIFALLYAGGFVLAVLALLPHTGTFVVSGAQFATLAYLGVIASGLGFFLWNSGAARVGSGLLAVMNNAKIPLMITASLLVFGEQASLPALAASFALMGGAVWLARKTGQI
jgi:drug/metabolite transporter (DMT)-like permease